MFKLSGGFQERRRQASVLALLVVLQACARQNEAVRSRQTFESIQGQGEGEGKRETERKEVISEFCHYLVSILFNCLTI